MKQCYYNYSYLLTLVLIFVLTPNTVFGQILIGSHELEDLFYDAHVKSLDEFIQRFNGREFSPIVQINDTNRIRTNRLLLFDSDIMKDIKLNDSIPSIYEEFVHQVSADSITISIENPNNWIEAICEFKWKESIKTLTLKMQLEEDVNHCWRWAVFDINGLKDSGLLNDEGVLQISPVEHEINFIGLESIFLHNYSQIETTRKTDLKIDGLSFFYGLIHSGELRYLGCKRVEFHCGQIPGYFFIVKEIVRMKSTNSGWLITSLQKNKYSNEK